MSLRADRLREARERLGLTQRQLATICELGEPQIYRYEAGRSEPTATHLKIVADKLGVTTDYLLGRSDDPLGQIGSGELNDDERAILSAFRRGSWPEVIHFAVDRMAQ
jgi:transcriptional regulator with XRE-family HTH domain